MSLPSMAAGFPLFLSVFIGLLAVWTYTGIRYRR